MNKITNNGKKCASVQRIKVAIVADDPATVTMNKPSTSAVIMKLSLLVRRVWLNRLTLHVIEKKNIEKERGREEEKIQYACTSSMHCTRTRAWWDRQAHITNWHVNKNKTNMRPTSHRLSSGQLPSPHASHIDGKNKFKYKIQNKNWRKTDCIQIEMQMSLCRSLSRWISNDWKYYIKLNILKRLLCDPLPARAHSPIPINSIKSLYNEQNRFKTNRAVVVGLPM